MFPFWAIVRGRAMVWVIPPVSFTLLPERVTVMVVAAFTVPTPEMAEPAGTSIV